MVFPKMQEGAAELPPTGGFGRDYPFWGAPLLASVNAYSGTIIHFEVRPYWPNKA